MKAKRIVSLLIACTLFAASAPVATFAEEMPSVGEEVTFEEAFDESAPTEDAEPALKADVEEADEIIAEAVEDSDMDASTMPSNMLMQYLMRRISRMKQLFPGRMMRWWKREWKRTLSRRRLTG